MNENQKAIEILGNAIKKEIKSFNLYNFIAKRIDEKKVRFLCKNLANEEDLHRRMIEDRYIFLSEGKVPMISVDNIHFDEIPSVSIKDRDELLQMAVAMEENSIEYYQKQLNLIDDEKGREILEDLLSFEKEHKRKILEM